MNKPVLGAAVYGALQIADVETWALAANVHRVAITGNELQALCPVTSNPDVYDFTITHSGGRECESKALKMYLMGFRDKGISCADLAARIAEDLSWLLGTPVWVELTQQTRGGMRLGATAEGRA